MTKEANTTRNTSGSANMCPPVEWKPCSVSALIDDLIKDGWIAPDDRFKEIATIYKGQTAAAHRQIRDFQEYLDRKAYTRPWVWRWLDAVDAGGTDKGGE